MAAILGAWLIAATALPASARDPFPPQANETGRWIVTLQPGANPRVEATKLARAVDSSPDHVFEHALNGFSFRGDAGDVAALLANAKVASVVPDRALRIADEVTPLGVQRIDAEHPSAFDAHEAGYTGAGVRIGILDTGIDLNHPDLTVDAALGKNCMGAGAPEDGHGHGTHVAGIAAALEGNDLGVVGVAPAAAVVPVKVLDDTGNGTNATVICGIDYLTGLATDGDMTNDVLVANMSLGEESTNIGSCTDGGLHQAICESIAAGVTYVVAAGNSTIDTSGFVPAAYPEVITVSALMDLDGEAGGLGGCIFFFCDDGLAFFSNFGSVVDVTAPGWEIYSTWNGDGYASNSGTSMAAPHVAGAVALVKAAFPGMTPADIETWLKVHGECPDGSWTDEGAGEADCGGQGQWPGDPDGIAEPIVNALLATNGGDHAPTISITNPADGATVAGVVQVTADAVDEEGIDSVFFAANGAPISVDTDGADGWSALWDATGALPGIYNLSATVTDTANQTASDGVTVLTGTNPHGDWVGAYGADGHLLAAWNESSDQSTLPATLTLEQGARWRWAETTAEVRALESADEAFRRAAAFYDSSQLRLRLDFPAAYDGVLHLYAVDWDNQGRRQRMTVDDGSGLRSVELNVSYVDGAWIHVPISVAAGGTVRITATKTGGLTAVLSGIFLGAAGEPVPPPPPIPPPTQAPQGDWAGAYGADGHLLAAWNGGSDVTTLPATLTLEQGARWRWTESTTEVRALEGADQATRRAAAFYHASQLRLRLDFPAAYDGVLHLYAVDWDNQGRRQRMTIDDGSGPRAVDLAADYSQGAWIHVSISVAAGGTVRITATKTGGLTAVLSGIFLGDA